MPNFVEFSRENSRRDDDPMFTLQTRGLISMNQAAFKALGSPVAVALLYDAAEGIVALKKVAKNYANGYLVRKQGQSNSYLVAGQGFTSFNKIPCDVSRRFVGHEYGDYTWGFDLDEGTEVKGTRRSAGSTRSEARPERQFAVDEGLGASTSHGGSRIPTRQGRPTRRAADDEYGGQQRRLDDEADYEAHHRSRRSSDPYGDYPATR